MRYLLGLTVVLCPPFGVPKPCGCRARPRTWRKAAGRWAHLPPRLSEL